MSRVFICDFADGDNIDEVLLVRDRQTRTNRNGNMYLQLELDDRSGTISARYWNATENDARKFDLGDYVAVKGKVQLFQGQLQLIINSFQRADADRLNPADFVPVTEKNIDLLLVDLRDILGRLANPHLKALGQAFLIDEEFLGRFCRAPAGIRHHHAYLGGLLEHVVTMMKVADRIADLYPRVDFDLLKVGILLHDLGKIRELTYDRGFGYSDEGQLVGHVVLGVEMLDDKLQVAYELLGEPVPDELVMRLKHLIVSHHGTQEFGSPRVPMIPEAAALHHLDNLDAKIHHFTQAIKEDANPDAAWTPYDPSQGRRIYKGVRPPRGTNGSASNGLPNLHSRG